MYFYLGYDNQALSISYELAKESRPFPTTQIILSLKTIHVLLLSSQKTDLTFKLNSTGNQPNYCISKNILKYINLETIDTTKGDQNYSEYLEYLEFPLECYQSLLKRIIKPETTKIFIFTNSSSESRLWTLSTSLPLTLITLQSLKPNFSLDDNVIYVSDEKALQNARRYNQVGILAGIQSGAVLEMVEGNDDNACFVLPDSIFTLTDNNDLKGEETSRNVDVGVIDIDERQVNSNYYRYVVDDLQLPNATTVFEDDSLGKALELMGLNEFSQLPVLDKRRRVIGMISRQPLQPLKVSDCYTKFTRQEYFKVTPLTRLVDLNLGFQKSDFLFVTIDGFPLAVVTREDVEKFWRRVKGRS